MRTYHHLNQSENSQVDYLYSESHVVTKNAPFGTADTPSQRVRIIAGRPTLVRDEVKFASPRMPEDEAADSPSPVSYRRGGRGAQSPNKQLRLGPLGEKPTAFDPTPFQHKSKNFYASAHQDSYNSHIHSPDPGKSFSPHRVVPPIGGAPPPTAPQSTLDSRIRALTSPLGALPPPALRDLTDHLPASGYLPERPVVLDQQEELELRQRVRADMDGFSPAQLKDAYMELTQYDGDLTGYVPYSDLGFALLRAKIHVSAVNLRLVSSLFIEPSMPGNVNYEKVLAFISAAVRDTPPAPHRSIPPPEPHPIEVREGKFYNPITHEMDDFSQGPPLQPLPPIQTGEGQIYNPITHCVEDFRSTPRRKAPSPRSKKFPYGDRDNAKLLRMIEHQILSSDDDLDFDRVWTVFSQADRQHRGMLSRDQIKQLSMQCRMPLQESIINQIIDKCDASNGQYNWQQFVEFIERVQPMRTGLPIPLSKKPIEYVKQIPVVTNTWPGTQTKESFNPPRMSELPHQMAPPAHSPAPFITGRQSRADHPTNIDKLQTDLKLMERDYEATKARLLEEEEKRKLGAEPWFERFMLLAKALYNNDPDHTGQIPRAEVQWLVKEYNTSYQLGLEERDLDKALDDTRGDNGQVVVDRLLKQISLLGP